MMTYSNEQAFTLLPKDWVSLFVHLSVSVERGVMWFQEVTSSQYSVAPWWFTLLDNLTTHDPTIEDNQLQFRPRFLLLPAVLQERFLQFLLAQADIIPDGILHELLSALENHIQQSGVGSAELKKLATISRYTEKLGLDLEQQSDRQMTSNNVNVEASLKSQNIVSFLDDSSDDNEPQTKRRKLDSWEGEEDTVLISDSPEQCDSGEDDSPIPVFTQMNFSQQPSVSYIEEDELDGNAEKEFASVLKDTWQNCLHESVPEFFHELTKISASDMESVLQSLDFVTMSDDSVKLACDHLCSLEESLSYTVVVMFMSRALSPRLKTVGQSASRKLTEAVINTAEKFPKQFIDGVFTSCVGEQVELSVGQSELFCKIIKDCWSSSSREYSLHLALQRGLEVHESNIQLLQTILEHECQISEADLQMFVTKLAPTALVLAKNLKFSKFLLAFVTHCGQKFSASLLPEVERIVNIHQTFMKKKIVAALNKVKLK
ncbi:uncharacterized protein LOC128232061 [Mya arenaria]|uniref:uncharacterized protein LOC128232061 n=1 Tax=Mya arenaria TaxID=6604 RepID=UPI0022E76CC4|nr:uncharacterized protein LOC128232061 [Mya arenaria]XP_052801362.1 uncharacterized protein LOC128232061 [Mya arenaria]